MENQHINRIHFGSWVIICHACSWLGQRAEVHSSTSMRSSIRRTARLELSKEPQPPRAVSPLSGWARSCTWPRIVQPWDLEHLCPLPGEAQCYQNPSRNAHWRPHQHFPQRWATFRKPAMCCRNEAWKRKTKAIASPGSCQQLRWDLLGIGIGVFSSANMYPFWQHPLIRKASLDHLV